MLKAILLSASLVLPAIALAAPAPAAMVQSTARASKGSGVKSLKGARSRSKTRRQGRSNAAAGNAGKRSARRGRSTRTKTQQAK